MSAHVSNSQANAPKWPLFKPFPQEILWGGAGLLALGCLLNPSPGPLTLLGWVSVSGAIFWAIRRGRKGRSPQSTTLPPQSLTPEILQQALAATEQRIEQLVAETLPHNLPSPFRSTLTTIQQSLSRQTLDLQVCGTPGAGKKTLQKYLTEHAPAEFRQKWVIAPLDEPQQASLTHTSATAGTALLTPADVVLFMVQGDLTQSERLHLQNLCGQIKRVIVLLNKQDQYLPSQLEFVIAQLKERVQDVIAGGDVLAIATNPQPIKVRRHQPDGTYEDDWETPAPQLQPLLSRLQTIATQDVSQLVLHRAFQQLVDLQQAIQADLNRSRRDRALPLIERYQWIAAGTAFANPLPSLDMVATAAITGKLVQEIGAIYQISLSLECAVDIAQIFATTLIRMGFVEASSQILSTALKGNAATFAAGGILQGIGAAYFTRIAAFSLIELFEINGPEANWSLEKGLLGPIIERVFQNQKQLVSIKSLINKAQAHFQSDPFLLGSAVI